MANHHPGNSKTIGTLSTAIAQIWVTKRPMPRKSERRVKNALRSAGKAAIARI